MVRVAACPVAFVADERPTALGWDHVRYGVIGAGALGLTVALRLSERGHEVTVIERGNVPGGLAASFEIEPDLCLERYYHHIFRSDHRIIRLIQSLGLGASLRWYRPSTTVLVDGRVTRLDTLSAVLRFWPLSPIDRIRLAVVVALLKVVPSARLFGMSRADPWMRRAVGRRCHEVVWEPLLRAKFGAAYERVLMSWLWARLHDRTTRLGYLDGGFDLLYRALADNIQSGGGRIRYSTTATGIAASDGAVTVEIDGPDGQGVLAFDRVVSTLPSGLTARLTSSLDDAYRSAHPIPESRTAHCLVLQLSRPVTGTYWIGICDEEWAYQAVVEHTAMTGTEPYGGRTLVYLGAYRAPGHPLLHLTPHDHVRLAVQHLQMLDPSIQEGDVERSWNFVAPLAQPIVDRTFAESIPGFETPLPGLYVASMFQVYPHDRGQNYSIELAERLVAALEHEKR